MNGSSLELDEVLIAEATVTVDCEGNELVIALEDEEASGIEASANEVAVISVAGCGEGTGDSGFKEVITPAPWKRRKSATSRARLNSGSINEFYALCQ